MSYLTADGKTLISGVNNKVFHIPPNQLLNNLVAYWRLDETSGILYDSVGLHDSSVVGAGVSYNSAQKKIGNAVSFNQTASAYIQVKDTSALIFETSDVTMGGWFYTTLGSSVQLGIFGGETGSFAFNLYNSSAFLGNTNMAAYFYTLQYTASVWNFFAIVFNSNQTTNNAMLYLNGQTETITANFNGTAGRRNNLIGQDSPSAVPFNGSLDELFMYKDRMLTISELNYLYNGGNGRAYPFN